MTAQRISLTVNGHRLEAAPRAGWTLLHYLRNELGLTGTRQGCASGGCGACTILLNGSATQSCQLSLAASAGCEIETIEALRTTSAGEVVTNALIEARAAQCGYCLPGIVATAVSTLNAKAQGSDLISALERHICRCGTQHRILAGLEAAFAELGVRDE